MLGIPGEKWAPRRAPKDRREELSPGGREKPPGAATLVNDFAVEGEIEAVAFHFFGDTQADGDVDDL